MEARRAVGRCPACQAALETRRLACPECGTSVEGRFAPSRYALLAPDEEAFLDLFLRVRGNLREVERVLGLSYPTVRARLDGVLNRLGLAADESAPDPEEIRAQRLAVLGALERGEISVAAAADRIAHPQRDT